MPHKPSIITARKVLPFDALEPSEFERLSLWLVEREGYLRPQHFGDAGSDQGRDVVAYKKGEAGDELWYFQCKRYQKISSRLLQDEVDKYNDLARSYPAKKCTGIVFITNARIAARAREIVADYCEEFGYQCDFWARTELDMRVKKYWEIVEEFFSAGENLRSQAPELEEVLLVQKYEHLIQTYRDNLQSKVSKVSILGDTTKHELTDVFVKLTVVNRQQKPSTRSRTTYWSLMDADLRRRRNPFEYDDERKNDSRDSDDKEQVRQTVNADDLLRENTWAMVVGAPGSGKSTLLRYLASKTLQREQNLPVFLELKTITTDDFRNANGNLETLIFEKSIVAPLRLRDDDRLGMKQIFYNNLKEGKVSIFLDGLDEVTGTDFFGDLQHSIKDFLDSSHRHNNLIITTRPYAARAAFNNVGLELEIKPLDLGQIQEFIKRYFGENTQTRRFLDDVQS
ncbi:MAG: restriction endonuclease, partial [Pyrinomonadaceae bacterium]